MQRKTKTPSTMGMLICVDSSLNFGSCFVVCIDAIFILFGTPRLGQEICLNPLNNQCQMQLCGTALRRSTHLLLICIFVGEVSSLDIVSLRLIVPRGVL